MAEEMAMEGMEQEAPALDHDQRGSFLEAAEAGASPEGRGQHMLQLLEGEGIQEADPAMLEQLDSINGAMVDMMYNPKTKASVQKMLKSGPPEMAIPATTNMLMQRFEDIMTPKNGPMDLQMKLGVGVMTFSEVQELAQQMGVIPKELNEQQMQGMLQATIQQYIQKGLKEKTIDPIELQLQVEPLLTPEEQAMGRGMSSETGTPQGPTREMQNHQMIQGAQEPLNVKNQQLMEQNKKMNQALQGVAQGQGGA